MKPTLTLWRENKSNAIISSHFFLSHLLDLINSPHFPSCNAGLLSAAFHVPVKCAMLLALIFDVAFLGK